VGFLHRHPFATDAYELGFAPGVREDYDYGTCSLQNVDLPVVILDNDFRNPDIDRYLDYFETYDPSVAILGDAHTPVEAQGLNQIARQLQDEYPHRKYVIVPKCHDAFDLLDDDLVLGYPMGYSDIQADDYSTTQDWRGQRVHLLGASPTKQYDVIEKLTQPTLISDPPADIVGLDWNGIHKGAYLGEYWTPNGWQPADHLSIRTTVRRSLRETKQFWQEKDVWPETEPIDLFGPAVLEPNKPVYAVNGGDIETREQLEDAIVTDYEEKGTLAYRNETEQAFLEWRERL